jgi:hypothetical protein
LIEPANVAYWHIASFRCCAIYVGYRGIADLAKHPPGRFMSSRPNRAATAQAKPITRCPKLLRPDRLTRGARVHRSGRGVQSGFRPDMCEGAWQPPRQHDRAGVTPRRSAPVRTLSGPRSQRRRSRQAPRRRLCRPKPKGKPAGPLCAARDVFSLQKGIGMDDLARTKRCGAWLATRAEWPWLRGRRQTPSHRR